jgi:uncharacterized membrane protein YphA (DoxX/SURF4 family)
MKKWLTLAARILMGLLYFVFGLNGLVMLTTGAPFITPPPNEGVAATFMGALFASGYMFWAIKLVETLGGVLLLAGRYVPLALTLLGGVTLNIFLFHAFLAPAGLAVGLFLLVAHLYLIYAYRQNFRALFESRPLPV